MVQIRGLQLELLQVFDLIVRDRTVASNHHLSQNLAQKSVFVLCWMLVNEVLNEFVFLGIE